MPERTEFEERRVSGAYYVGMALNSCLDEERLAFLLRHGYDVKKRLQELLEFLEELRERRSGNVADAHDDYLNMRTMER